MPGDGLKGKWRGEKEHMREKLTKSEVRKIQEEIEHRKLVVRKDCLEAVKEARAHGDLSENFEYHAAKREKNQNESRIRYLENMLKNAVLISEESKEDEVGLNNTVTLYMEDHMISTESPLGKAVLHRKVGDRVLVKANDAYSYYVIIRKIENTDDGEDQIRRF